MQARIDLPVPVRAAADAALAGHLTALLGHLAPASLGFCWPYRAEFDMRDVVAAWLHADTTRWAALPVVGVTGVPMRWRRWDPRAELPLDRYGIPFPGDGPDLHPELLLIPCNGFDARGYRIGYGAGHFDRTLAAMQPRPLAIGVAYELARLPDTQPQAHDLPMDWLITEGGAWPRQSS
ncbi:MAG: 5-formyltetrahydrofolate cyclo-ligase [Betaproteobacteria bacterium]|nr:5-formyltetrahydrofolate cyclo-ligase [Betaproteobacteria bacterium]